MMYNKGAAFEVTRGTFIFWLLQQRDRDDHIGDLARDIYNDTNFPNENPTIKQIYSYICYVGNDFVASIALEAYREWKTIYPPKIKNTRKRKNDTYTLSTRFNVLRRDGYKCRLCGRTAQDGITLEIDHIVPRSKGGNSHMSNLQVLCFECNRGKRDKTM